MTSDCGDQRTNPHRMVYLEAELHYDSRLAIGIVRWDDADHLKSQRGIERLGLFIAYSYLESGTQRAHIPEDLKNTQHEPHANAAALVARLYCQPEDPALEGSLLESEDKASHLSTYFGDKSAAGMVFIEGRKDVRIVPSEDLTVDLQGCLQVVRYKSPDYDGITVDCLANPVREPPLNLFLWPHSIFARDFSTEIVFPTGIEKGLRRLSVDFMATNINNLKSILFPNRQRQIPVWHHQHPGIIALPLPRHR